MEIDPELLIALLDNTGLQLESKMSMHSLTNRRAKDLLAGSSTGPVHFKSAICAKQA